MSNLLKALEEVQNTTTTANGMTALRGTGSSLVDFFNNAPPIHPRHSKRVFSMFEKAYRDNPVAALRLLFWLRDIRGGSGRRQSFQVIIRAAAEKGFLLKEHIAFIPEFGRFDDVFSLFGTPLEKDALEFYAAALNGRAVNPVTKESYSVELAAKWAPSLKKVRPVRDTKEPLSKTKRETENGRKLRQHLCLTQEEYRKFLSSRRRVVETQMSNHKWSSIKYEAVPSVASSRYVVSFLRHDEKRFMEFLTSGKVNSKDLYPHDIGRLIKSDNPALRATADAYWKALPDLFDGEDHSVLPVIDVSGSMDIKVSGSVRAMDVSILLGTYLAQRIKGPFNGSYISFSRTPKFHQVRVDEKIVDIYNRVRYKDVGYDTNVEAVFKLILSAAKKKNLSQDDMPEKVLILSDMHFNGAQGPNKYSPSMDEMLNKMYADAGYKKPVLVYWNLNSSMKSVAHGSYDDNSVVFVGGFSPSVMKFVLNDTKIETLTTVDATGKTITKEAEVRKTPIEIVMDVVNSERYSCIQ